MEALLLSSLLTGLSLYPLEVYPHGSDGITYEPLLASSAVVEMAGKALEEELAGVQGLTSFVSSVPQDRKVANDLTALEETGIITRDDIQLVLTGGFLEAGQEVSFPFKLSVASNVNVNLYGLSGNVDMRLQDVAGNLLATSNNPGSSPDAIAEQLGAGSYTITLSSTDTVGTAYRLSAASLANRLLKSPTLVEYVILPTATDSTIDNPVGPHYIAFDPAVASRGQLFVFFPGTNGQPLDVRLIVQKAASLGYHAIGLAYPNSTAITSAGGCRFSQNPDCAENLRLEIFDGIDRSSRLTITRSNSIENRLIQVLRYLDQQYPGQGWSNYLIGDQLQWNAMVLAGHSQGGGHAAIIAKNNLVARSVLFAPELDYSPVFNDFAPWVAEESATPVEAYYAFQHVGDSIFSLPRQLEAFNLLGLDTFGPPVNVDQAVPPYNGSHQLTTAAPPPGPGQEHASVVVDGVTPRLPNGVPLYSDVWGYLLGQSF